MVTSLLHTIAARGCIITASVYTAVLQLFSASSLAYRAAGAGMLIDAINVVVLILAALALADLLWRDILRRGLILPRLDPQLRHQFCVWLYSALSAAFGIRAFLAMGEPSAALQAGTYYVLFAAWIAVEAAAIANEQRSDKCPSTCDGA